jgi:hypothetical protein
MLAGTMKKLAIAATFLSLSIAAPVFACPEGHETTHTADKAKDAPKDTAKADKAKAATPADKAAKPADKAKPGDKVSQR